MAWRLITTNVFIRIGKTPVVQANSTAFGRVVPAYHTEFGMAYNDRNTMPRQWREFGPTVLLGIRKTVGADLSQR